MDPEPDLIRQQQEIDRTRESLVKKVETLENEIKDTVSEVTGTVKETLDTVKETVSSVTGAVENTVDTVKNKVEQTFEETVDTVKRTFDIPYQVQRHPWAMAGGALLAGLATGYLVSGRRRPASSGRRSYAAAPAARTDLAGAYPDSTREQRRPERAEEQGPGLLSRLLAPFESEIDKVKEVAIGTLMGLARDALKQSLPPALAANVEEIMDSATRKAGGAPVRGPVLTEACSPGGETADSNRGFHGRSK
jgi:ElaB/YqjD/DUF883 family membrane-anchored ribosome-binding protein